MQESQEKSLGALGIASLILAILAGVLTAVGAWIPGGFAGLVAAVLAFKARDRAGDDGTARTIATLGLILGALVVLASIVLVITDQGT